MKVRGPFVSVGTAAALLLSRNCGFPAPEFFERVEIDARPPNNPWVKIVGDLSGDGRPDVIIGGSAGPLVWYANPGWSKGTIAAGGYDSVGGAVGDIDGDGDGDVVIGGILWYENPGPKRDPARDVWTAHRIGTHHTHDVEVGDLDGDRKLDVVVRGQSGFGSKEGHRVFVWKQLSPTNWTSREISCPHGEGLRLFDMNRDSRSDLVIPGRWFQNPGDIARGDWTEHVFTTNWTHADAKVAVGDLNRDGRPDVILSPAEFQGGTYRIAWFEAPTDPNAGAWKEHVVEEPVETVIHALEVADMDADGFPDIVAAHMHQGKSPQEVCVFFNRGGGTNWRKEVLSIQGSHNVVVVDIDGDGRLDVVGANHGGTFQAVELWKNKRPPQPHP